MKALETFLAEQDLDQVQITDEDFEAMRRALIKLADAPSFGGFGGPANFVKEELFQLYMAEYYQQQKNKERMTLIEWLILLWILKQWQESTNNLKPDPEPDQQYMLPLNFGDSIDRISTALGIGENDLQKPTMPKTSPRLKR